MGSRPVRGRESSERFEEWEVNKLLQGVKNVRFWINNGLQFCSRIIWLGFCFLAVVASYRLRRPGIKNFRFWMNRNCWLCLSPILFLYFYVCLLFSPSHLFKDFIQGVFLVCDLPLAVNKYTLQRRLLEIKSSSHYFKQSWICSESCR